MATSTHTENDSKNENKGKTKLEYWKIFNQHKYLAERNTTIFNNSVASTVV